MNKKIVLATWTTCLLFCSSLAFAQAFGEYGRAVGSIPQGRGITGGGVSGGGSHGNARGTGVQDLGGRPLPMRLVVASPNADLFPRQDAESEKITQLSQGESLVLMVQSEGSNPWYMVKTQNGLVGWVKSVDVKQENAKK